MKIEIKNIYGCVLFSYDTPENTITKTVCEATRQSANLQYADLQYADLRSAKGVTLDLYDRLKHLPDGEIIGYKKLSGRIIKLLIPASAKRVQAIGARKCRAEFAKVLSIEGGDELLNKNYSPLLYKLGETVYPDFYDEDFTVEYSHGINFFISEIEAKDA